MRSSFQADHSLPNDTYKIWAISGLLYPQRLCVSSLECVVKWKKLNKQDHFSEA